MEVRDLQKLIVDRRNAYGFGAETPEQSALGLCCEAGEAGSEIMREYRYGKARKPADDKSSLPNELADVAFYFFSILESTGINIEEAVKNKIKINDVRFLPQN